MSFDIPFLRPNLVKSESYQKYLDQIDASNIYSNFGPLNCEFEKRILSYYFEKNGAVSTVSNGTIGLILAISESKRSNARYALMPSFTFAATPLAANWCGLEPYFIDVNPDTWCLDKASICAAIDALGDEIAVIVPYATFGTAIDLKFYSRIHEDGIPVVVDAAPCFGTMSGNNHFGKDFPGVLVFSFHATKTFGLGEGGLVYSGDAAKINEIRLASNFGFSGGGESLKLGINGKFSEYVASIALATLDEFPKKIQKRLEINSLYRKYFEKYALEHKGWVFQQTEGEIPYQFQPVLCPDNTSSLYFVNKLERAGIQARTYFNPCCHHQKQFRSCNNNGLANTELLSRRILSLPLWEGMTGEMVEKVVKCLM